MKKQLYLTSLLLFSVMVSAQSETAVKNDITSAKQILAANDGRLRLEEAGSIYIPAGSFLTVEDGITNIVTRANFINESDDSLIQLNNGITNTGNITSKREFKINKDRNQYNYLGSSFAFEPSQSYKTIFSDSNTEIFFQNQAANKFLNSSEVNVSR